jgi:mannose-6-phosphate isomerase-like protein (cupin superfamily)
MKIFHLFDEISYKKNEPVKRDLIIDPHYKLVTIGVETGVTISPCIMQSEMIFYVVEGSGSIKASDVVKSLTPGDIVVVPAQASRSITADQRLSILAIQVHRSTLDSMN